MNDITPTNMKYVTTFHNLYICSWISNQLSWEFMTSMYVCTLSSYWGRVGIETSLAWDVIFVYLVFIYFIYSF